MSRKLPNLSIKQAEMYFNKYSQEEQKSRESLLNFLAKEGLQLSKAKSEEYVKGYFTT